MQKNFLFWITYQNDVFSNMPPFLVGRVRWDNWLVAQFIGNMDSVAVDSTRVVLAVHLNHMHVSKIVFCFPFPHFPFFACFAFCFCFFFFVLLPSSYSVLVLRLVEVTQDLELITTSDSQRVKESIPKRLEIWILPILPSILPKKRFWSKMKFTWDFAQSARSKGTSNLLMWCSTSTLSTHLSSFLLSIPGS